MFFSILSGFLITIIIFVLTFAVSSFDSSAPFQDSSFCFQPLKDKNRRFNKNSRCNPNLTKIIAERPYTLIQLREFLYIDCTIQLSYKI